MALVCISSASFDLQSPSKKNVSLTTMDVMASTNPVRSEGTDLIEFVELEFVPSRDERDNEKRRLHVCPHHAVIHPFADS